MQKPTILITSATGKTGFEAAKQLLTEGYPVRILVRSKKPKALELAQLGAEIVLGNLDNYHDMVNALTGIDNVYYCYPLAKGMPESVAELIKAAKEQKTRAIVFMGQWLAEFPDQQSLVTNDIKKCYQLLEESGLNIVYYNPGFFAENVIALTEGIVQLGIMPSPFGDGKCPWISAADQGRVIASLLKNPVPHFGRKVHPTGPVSISAQEMAAAYSKILGRKVSLMPISDDMFLKAVMAASDEYGYTAFDAVQTVFYMQEFRKNRFAEGGPTNVVKELTGNEPEDFETIARHFISTSPYQKRSLSKQITAMGKFMKLLRVKIPGKKEQMALNSN